MNNDLTKWGGGVPSRVVRQTAAAMQLERSKAAIEAIKLDNVTKLRMLAMQGAVDLDNFRQQAAANNPELNLILGRIEMGYVSDTEQIIRNHTNPFGF